jgi:sugar phosphate isomerase/epimerase
MKLKLSILLLHLMVAINLSAQTRGDIPFFVFNSGVKDSVYNTPDKQAGLLKELGYDGMELNGIEGLAATLDALDKHGLELYTVYINVNLDDRVNPFDPKLPEVFRMLEGRKTMPWFYITSKNFKPSSSENDAIAVPILQQIADMAQLSGVKVMLYPHVNFWVDNVDDAVRVASKVNRRNLGITFNLCHFLADQGTRSQATFNATVERAMPYLFAISLNGADMPSEEIMRSKNIWQYLIQPLGDGSYDTYAYLEAFLKRGFRGPVGLQTYNIPGPREEHLKRSMSAWKKMWVRLE